MLFTLWLKKLIPEWCVSFRVTLIYIAIFGNYLMRFRLSGRKFEIDHYKFCAAHKTAPFAKNSLA